MADYIPSTDAGFDNWQKNVVTLSIAGAKGWGIPDEVIAELTTEQTSWTSAYTKAENRKNRTSADVATKNEAGVHYKKYLRGFSQQWLINNPKLTDADRVRLMVTVKSGTHTQVSIPETFPVVTVDFSIRQQHTISYYDEASSHSNAKPAGVHGCEIFMKVDNEAPKFPEEFVYLGTCTASPYVVKFQSDQVGKTAYYLLRWVNTRGETGPWSTIVSAMIVR